MRVRSEFRNVQTGEIFECRICRSDGGFGRQGDVAISSGHRGLTSAGAELAERAIRTSSSRARLDMLDRISPPVACAQRIACVSDARQVLRTGVPDLHRSMMSCSAALYGD